jgi:hypothetical protein
VEWSLPSGDYRDVCRSDQQCLRALRYQVRRMPVQSTTVKSANTAFRLVLNLLLAGLAIILGSAYVQSAEPTGTPGTRALLNSCLETQRKTDWVLFQGHSELDAVSLPTPLWWKQTLRYRRRGDLIDVVVTPIVGERNPRVSRLSARPHRILCRPDLYLNEGLPLPDETRGNMSWVAQETRVQERTRFLNDPGCLGVLDGYLDCIDGKRVPELMIESSDSRLLDDEHVGMHLCKVVEAKSPCGVYKLWLDTDCGCLPRKALLVKRAEDLLSSGKRLCDQKADGPFPVEAEWTLSEIVFSRIANIWIATQGQCTGLFKLSDGSTQGAHYTLSRSNVEFHPTFAKREAFVPTVSDGEMVVNLDDPFSGISYRMNHAKVEPVGKDYVATQDAGNWTRARSQSGVGVISALSSFVALALCLWFFVRLTPERPVSHPGPLETPLG